MEIGHITYLALFIPDQQKSLKIIMHSYNFYPASLGKLKEFCRYHVGLSFVVRNIPVTDKFRLAPFPHQYVQWSCSTRKPIALRKFQLGALYRMRLISIFNPALMWCKVESGRCVFRLNLSLYFKQLTLFVKILIAQEGQNVGRKIKANNRGKFNTATLSGLRSFHVTKEQTNTLLYMLDFIQLGHFGLLVEFWRCCIWKTISMVKHI